MTVDGAAGTIVDGTVRRRAQTPESAPSKSRGLVTRPRGTLVTATKLYVNLAEPRARRGNRGARRRRRRPAARRVHDGRGARAHASARVPRATQRRRVRAPHGRGAEDLRTRLRPASGRSTVPWTFARTSFETCTGGPTHEPTEANPMIGYRGCSRYIREPDLFALEFRALAEVRRRIREPAPDDSVRPHARRNLPPAFA